MVAMWRWRRTLAIWFVSRIAMHDPHAVVLNVAPK